MIVACILVNRTHWSQVRGVLARLREACPTPEDVAKYPMEDMARLIGPLGLYNRRANMLRRFAIAWTNQEPRTSEDLVNMPGCGPYAIQSWVIFIEGKIPEGVVDHKLAWYVKERMGGEGR